MRSIFAATAALTALAMAAPAMADHHGATDHSTMDHSTMDHSTMDHSKMDHGAAAGGQSDSYSALLAAAANPARAEDAARDEYRHPVETLGFFGVVPGMTVVDMIPGGGWYTRLLVPYLGKDGQYIGMNPHVARANSDSIRENWGGFAGKFPAQLAEWGLADSNAKGMNLDEAGDDMAGTVDRVLIFREMHNLFRLEMLHSTLQGARKLLKDDGMLGIVQHRAKEDAPADYTNGSKGYMREQDVIAIAEMYGFELADSNEINANPADTADHPRGVWEMKPGWGSKRPELENIGESDRMTLIFQKRK